MNNNKPAIRFKGFSDAWEQRKLNEGIIEHKEITTENNQYPPLTSSRKGLFLQTEYFAGNQIASEDNTGYNVVPRGYFTYRHMSDDEIFHFNINEIVENGIVSTLYPVFTTNENLDSKYLQYQLNYGKEFSKFAVLQKQGGSRTYMYLSKLKQLHLTMPKNVVEQKKIARFLVQLDNLITLHQRECEFLYSSQYRKNIQKYAYFTTAWEQRKLSDYLEVSNEKNRNNIYDKNDVLSVSGDYGIVNQIEFQGRSFAGASVSNYGVVHTNDIVYTKSPLNANPYGIIKTNKGKTGIVSTLYAIYHPKKNTFSNFVQNYFEQHARMNNYIHPLVNKGAKNDMKVSSENALKGYVIFPKYDEQVAISTFFEELDHLITLHQREPPHKNSRRPNIC